MKRVWIPQLIAIIMLLWALNPDNPYGYYRLLRLVCCVIFIYLCVVSINYKLQGWPWVLGTVALVYNPLVPLHMTRGIWSVVNIATILIAAVSIYFLRKDDSHADR